MCICCALRSRITLQRAIQSRDGVMPKAHEARQPLVRPTLSCSIPDTRPPKAACCPELLGVQSGRGQNDPSYKCLVAVAIPRSSPFKGHPGCQATARRSPPLTAAFYESHLFFPSGTRSSPRSLSVSLALCFPPVLFSLVSLPLFTKEAHFHPGEFTSESSTTTPVCAPVSRWLHRYLISLCTCCTPFQQIVPLYRWSTRYRGKNLGLALPG